MKKLLPRTSKNSQGFTLVELMVVISIIAILAIVGLTLYNNTQRGARDARRVQDMKAMANAYEVNYDSTNQRYSALVATMFSSGATPADPQNTTSPYNNSFAANSQAYQVCATQEVGGASFCLKNQR